MNTNSRKVLISCAAIALAACACLTVAAIASGGYFILFPQENTALNPTPESALITEEPQPTALPTRVLPAETEIEPTDEETASPTEELGETSTPEITSAPLEPVILDEMEEIEEQVVQIRGLDTEDPVDRTIITRDELREKTEEDFQEDYSEEEARDDSIELAVLGLVEPGFDFYNFYLDLLSTSILGSYDLEEEKMYIVQGEGFEGNERLTYAHEFAHVLQDKNYNIDEDLGYNEESCEEDSEKCAGVQALIEGEASFVEIAWLSLYATEEDILEIQEFYQNYESPTSESDPPFILEDQAFPYQTGMEFVQYLYEEGGWEAIDAAYLNPPVSTEQILHPERYPDDQPVPVELPDLESYLGTGWRSLSEDVIGEWYTYLILALGSDPNARIADSQARAAAEGWGGDAYEILYHDELESTVLVSKYVWESSREASQYAGAFQEYASARYGAPLSNEGGITSWETDEGFTLFTLSGEETVWITAPDEDTAQGLLELVQ